MLNELKHYVAELGADLSEKKGVWTFSKVIAERKAFLSKKKLTQEVRNRFESLAKSGGYEFKYQVTPIGL